MSRDSTDPPRLVDDPAAGRRLRDLVRAGRDDVGSKDEISRLEARLAPLLWPNVPSPTPDGSGLPGSGAGGAGAGPGAAGSAGIAKVMGVVAVIVGAAGAAYWLPRINDGASQRRVPATTTAGERKNGAPTGKRAETPEPAAPPSVTSEAAVPSALPAPTESSSAAQSTPSPRAAPRSPAPRQTPGGAQKLPTEAELLDAARRALDSNPKQALALARQHGRRFPNGMLAQEREVLEIAALKKLGREEAAEEKADDFRKSFPGSAHQRKVDGVVEKK